MSGDIDDFVRELIGLFIDDGSLAISIIVVVALAAILAGGDAPVPVTGGALFFDCITVLLGIILRTTRNLTFPDSRFRIEELAPSLL